MGCVLINFCHKLALSIIYFIDLLLYSKDTRAASKIEAAS